MWGLCIIISPSLRQSVLEELHSTHAGISRMKAIARSYFWWPRLDDTIADLAGACQDSRRVKSNPPKAPLHPWTWPARTWQHIHVDFASYGDQHYLVVVDAHSKWPEVIGPIKSTSANATADPLRSLFARHGLPVQVVSDNGPPFQSRDYDNFLKRNGVQRILVSPYHQSSNGQAERFIQTFKRFLETSKGQPNSALKVFNFLLSYRNTPHATTGATPAKLFLGRELRTRLSLLRPDVAGRVTSKQAEMKFHHDQHSKHCEVAIGDPVLAHNYCSKDKWQSIVDKSAPYSYKVQLENETLTWRRHTDQLLSAHNPPSKADTSKDVTPNPDQPSDDSKQPGLPEPPAADVLPDDATQVAEKPPDLRRSTREVNSPQRIIETC